jgi:hypothetical protein
MGGVVFSLWGSWLLVWVSRYVTGILTDKAKAILQVKTHGRVGFLGYSMHDKRHFFLENFLVKQ